MTNDSGIKITHCIFDMDGLLIDTERIYTEVSNEILAPYGHTFSWEVKSKMMGRTTRDSAEIIVKEYNLPFSPEEYMRISKIKQAEKFPECKPLPGVMKFIKHLKAHNIPIGVGTSSNTISFNLKTKYNQELFQLFDFVITGDNERVKKGKPSPDIFEEVAKDLGSPKPENCLVFEDAIVGVQAALNAKMNVIWIPDPNLKSMFDDVNAQGATEVLDSMEEFDPAKYGLPPYEN
ncbi:HAD-like protein [Conidiobolus coronatus NRRL 28638]|uniref:HAD-like protein n=1 Tax=Conidiobolus coronatus (strain ATCC 28846 / CBS 209.66 / NRRL 28638) TaxID=796925 RepID=A0A137P799_CONC2|nr:HAD-like protein [Conidiobolus coronatus NRRL 28638]|eukprot:KXN70886.1 HAD-like protein [Conidiobolus coronatus NRRL 28638]